MLSFLKRFECGLIRTSWKEACFLKFRLFARVEDYVTIFDVRFLVFEFYIDFWTGGCYNDK